MARKIKFPLEMSDGFSVRDLEELRDHFDIEKVLEYLLDGKRQRWLEDRYYIDEAEALSALDRTDIEFQRNVCELLGVEYKSTNISLGEIERKKQRIAKLKEYTEDAAVIENIDNVVFSQEELLERLNEGKKSFIFVANNLKYRCRKQASIILG